MSKVWFNIKKLQVSKITKNDTTGIEYASPIKVPGTVSLSIDSEQSTDSFYADGVSYYAPAGASSYTGTLENAKFSNEVLKEIFNFIEDSANNIIETDAAPNEFGMQFACDSDDGEVYFTYYRVLATKPGLNLQTSEASATINPQSVSITCSPITLSSGKSIVRSHAEKGATNYDTYFNSLIVPTI